MHTTITHASQFRDEFRACGRADQFSYEALGLLFDFLEETDSNYSLDVIAICCDYAEDTFEDFANTNAIDIEGLTEEEIESTVMAYLQNCTCVVGSTFNTVIYAQF